MVKILNSELMKGMLESGANHLTNQYQRIDALNVFPVPDGDTGTNMHLTFASGVRDCLSADSTHCGDLGKILSKGLLMGARGNSGVILSQIFRGFYQGIAEVETIDVKTFAYAWENGTKVAYKAVMRPVEGTILTVIRETSELGVKYIEENPDVDFITFMENFYQFSLTSLENTPNLLPVLKEVGVVDSGGAGLCVIFDGILQALKGNPIAKLDNVETVVSSATNLESEEFGYCTEFIITLNDAHLRDFDENELKTSLTNNGGESIVVVADDDIVKVHVHTLKPGDALNLAQKYGEFLKLKIENMSVQHEEITIKETPKEKTKYAIIAVASGEGIEKAFKELRADFIITGGQTMNPATEDFVSIIKKANADNIIILPNNSNIILAANQAASAFDDINIHVLPTKTIPQGLSACIMFNPEGEMEDNIAEMQAAIENTTSASVTYAIKDTVFNGLEIMENDYMGILEKDIIVTNTSKILVAKHLLDKLIKPGSEILTVIVGEDTVESETKEITDYLDEKFNVEYEVIIGKQPVYSFVFGVE